MLVIGSMALAVNQTINKAAKVFDVESSVLIALLLRAGSST